MFFTEEQINDLKAGEDPITLKEGDNLAILTREFHPVSGFEKPFRLELEIGNSRDDLVLFNGRVNANAINRTVWENFQNKI